MTLTLRTGQKVSVEPDAETVAGWIDYHLDMINAGANVEFHKARLRELTQ